MVINHNLNALNAHRNASLNTTATGKSMEKLSSGLRINRAADDAAGLSISEKMRGQIKGLTQAQRNAQDGISYIQTMEGALNEISDMLSRAKELNVQRENGTYSTGDKSNIDEELKALASECNNILSNTKFNGIGMNPTGGVTIQINDATSTLTIGLADADLKAADITANSTASIANITLTEALISKVSTARAKLGAQQNRLEHTSNNLGTTIENITASESRIRDTDMASEMSKFSSKNIITQASQAMLAQANQLQQNVLSLLR